jgi:hypothetical protein
MLQVAENSTNLVMMVNLGSFGSLNFKTCQAQPVHGQACCGMEGYMGGLMALNVSMFVPTFMLDTCCTMICAILSCISIFK